MLTDRAVDAVRKLGEAGILFAVTSGRPPRGMSMLIEPLDLSTPIAAFNGGLLVNRDMSVIEQRVLPEELVRPVSELFGSFGLDTWVYQGADWYVPDPKGAHVAKEIGHREVRAEGHDRPRRAHRATSPSWSGSATTWTPWPAPRPPPTTSSATT